MPELAHPWALLLLVPLAALVWWRLSRPPAALSQVLPRGWVVEGRGHLRRPLPWALRMAALATLVLALADPGFSIPDSRASGEGIAIMVAMDLSISMEAKDQEGLSRLDVAKEEVARFVSARSGDMVGLVTFGEEAVTRVPPTTQHSHLLKAIERLQVARQENGTALGTGLGLAVQRISRSPSPSRVVVLLTDGRNNTGSMDPVAVARASGELEVRVHAIGIGGQEGDDPLDEVSLREIARLSGGRFFRATDPRGFQEVMASVDAMERGPTPLEATFAHRSSHRAFLYFGLGLLILESLLWIVPGGRIR